MREKVGILSIQANNCHLTVVNDGQIVPIYFSEERGYECFLPKDAIFELRIAYMGFEACGYKVYIDGKPLGVNKQGVEISGALSFLKRDVHDNWQTFYGEKNKWKFDGNDTSIEFITYPATTSLFRVRGVEQSVIEKTDEPQLIDYKIVREWDKKETLILTIKEKSDIQALYS